MQFLKGVTIVKSRNAFLCFYKAAEIVVTPCHTASTSVVYFYGKIWYKGRRINKDFIAKEF